MKLQPIAIVGASCRLPGASSVPAFWRLLSEGRSAVSDIPKSRWDRDAYYDEDPTTSGKTNLRVGGFLEDAGGFDAEFFGIPPREAEFMDPQQRLLMEVSWEALESAAIAPASIAGTVGGVYIGMCSNEYGVLFHIDTSLCNAYSTTGNALSFAPNRLSRYYDLRGPSLVLDTACSSSLVALHHACQALGAGDIDMAMVGGVNLIVQPMLTIAVSKLWILSSAGMCRSFDAEADGFVRSEGCVVVILKRLADALRDKNPILGTVCGSAVSHDGARGGLTAPDVGAQQEIIGKALDSASVQAKQVAYIEAHGLASLMTDATELQAIDGVLGKGRPAGDPVLVSSVKPNIGHVETASGLTSLLKATLVMQNQQVPPLLHFSKLNPNAPKSNFYKICRTATPWPQGRTAYACVNSFGLGGTNAHVVLRGPNA